MQTLGAHLQRATTGTLLERAKPLAAKGVLAGNRLALTRRPLKVSTPQRQICSMTYAQAYEDPVATQRSNRVYTSFAVSGGCRACEGLPRTWLIPEGFKSSDVSRFDQSVLAAARCTRAVQL